MAGLLFVQEAMPISRERVEMCSKATLMSSLWGQWHSLVYLCTAISVGRQESNILIFGVGFRDLDFRRSVVQDHSGLQSNTRKKGLHMISSFFRDHLPLFAFVPAWSFLILLDTHLAQPLGAFLKL